MLMRSGVEVSLSGRCVYLPEELVSEVPIYRNEDDKIADAGIGLNLNLYRRRKRKMIVDPNAYKRILEGEFVIRTQKMKREKKLE